LLNGRRDAHPDNAAAKTNLAIVRAVLPKHGFSDARLELKDRVAGR
jgi:hypothetical protein